MQQTPRTRRTTIYFREADHNAFNADAQSYGWSLSKWVTMVCRQHMRMALPKGVALAHEPDRGDEP